MPDFYPNDVGHHHDHCCDDEHKSADCCDDQLPLFSTLGRGIKGDSFKVRVASDNCTETYLEGLYYDEASKTWHSDWVSENINGGELSYQYNLRPFTDPQTFTITFIYRRPGRFHTGIETPDHNNHNGDCCWSWTTPAIPYIWHVGDDGSIADTDNTVGSGVATIFVRASKSEAWNTKKHERLHYPAGTTRDDYNAPLPEKAWSATITFGHDGDVQLPNFDDLDKILGVNPGDTLKIVKDNTFIIDGVSYTNYRDYVDKNDKKVKKEVLEHVHKDLGFQETGADGTDHGYNNQFGGEKDVKTYIDKKVKGLQDQIDELEDRIDELEDDLAAANKHIYNLYGLLDDIINHIYGASKSEVNDGDSSSSTVPDGKGWKITWNPNAKIPQGTLNVYGGDDLSKWIKSHDNAANDDVHAR